jgi:hypothetical protein
VTDDLLEPALRGLTSALGKLTTGLGSVRTQLVAMDAASKARHEEHVRVTTAREKAERSQAAALRAVLRAVGQREEEGDEPDPVGDEVKGLQVKALRKAGSLLDAPDRIAAWLAADRSRTLFLLTTLAGLVADLSTGAGVMSALLRMASKIASTGSAQ